MTLAVSASGTQTATISTEHTLYTSSAAGVFLLEVNLVNMASGDTVELRVKGKTLTGDSVAVKLLETYSGAQVEPDVIVRSIPVPDDLALVFTLKQTAGTGRSFPWKVLSL